LTVPVRDAATVVLVRDGERSLEVLMLRRNLRSVFVAGAHVFPGGAVDDADRQPEMEAVCRGRTDADASRVLGVERGGLAFWVAAVRECFEEAGLLLAATADGEMVRLADPRVKARFALHRASVDAGRRRLVEVCRMEGLRLAVDAIHWFSHWITPEGAPRRYDTRFFVAAAPPEQDPWHDEAETIASEWVRPSDALDRYQRGEMELILPTVRSLETIASFGCAADLLASLP
jgi:8-oxo-dGTP pyrophosphatase MutT (NUDIX family)